MAIAILADNKLIATYIHSNMYKPRILFHTTLFNVILQSNKSLITNLCLFITQALQHKETLWCINTISVTAVTLVVY